MRTKKFHFPMAGKNENFAATTQPQFTSPSLSNVRPYDVLGNRARGGQRPGLKPAYQQILGSHFLESPSDIVALWHLDEYSVADAGTVADQEESYDLTAETNGGVLASSNSPVGHALVFDGTEDYLFSATADDDLNITGDLTIMAWCRLDDVSGVKTIVSRYITAIPIYQYQLHILDDDIFCKVVTLDGGDYDEYSASFIGKTYANQWFHVAVTIDGTTMTCYKNGVAGTPVTISGTRQSSAVNPTLVGNSEQVGDDFFGGAMADVMILDAALSASEILAAMNGAGSPVIDMTQLEYIEVT